MIPFSGCCWIVAALAAVLEAAYRLKHTNKRHCRLSIQNVLDCFKEKFPEYNQPGDIYDSKNCFSCSVQAALRYVRDIGVCKESKYKFKGKRSREMQRCKC